MTTRRRFLQTSVAAGLSLPLVRQMWAADQAPQDADWPLFRGDALSTGVAIGTLPNKPELVWKKEIKNGAFEATPAIVGDTVYIGDLDGRFYALNLFTGEERWKTEREAYFRASPAIRDGKIYVGDIDGVFYCFDQKTGKEEWTYGTDAEINGGPNFWKDSVLIGSQDSNLYCFDTKKKGELVWKFKIQDQIRCAPTIVGDRSFVAGCDSVFHILNLNDGTEVAAIPIEAPTGVTPAVLGDLVYFGTEAGVFFAIDWKKGEVAWKYEDPLGTQPFRGSPAVTEKYVIVGSNSKRVRAFDPAKGTELWSFTTKQRIDSSPVIVGDRVFVGTTDGKLYGLTCDKGQEVWQFEGKGGFLGSPAVAHGKLVIASERGMIYCFGAKGL